MAITTIAPISAMEAFGLLMQAAFGQKEPIRGLETTVLEDHPFRLTVPVGENQVFDHPTFVYVGRPGHTDVSVEGIIRLIGLYIGEWDFPVRFLRTILVGNSEGHDVYYEIVINDRAYICGGCTDCSGGGGNGKETMDGIMALLSIVYCIPVQTKEISYDGDGQIMVAELLKEDMEKKDTTPLVASTTFVAGQTVRFSEFAFVHPPSSMFCKAEITAKARIKIAAVETIGSTCSCGLNEEVHLSLHPERCALRTRTQQMHHQMLHFPNLGGAARRLSGVFFTAA